MKTFMKKITLLILGILLCVLSTAQKYSKKNIEADGFCRVKVRPNTWYLVGKKKNLLGPFLYIDKLHEGFRVVHFWNTDMAYMKDGEILEVFFFIATPFKDGIAYVRLDDGGYNKINKNLELLYEKGANEELKEKLLEYIDAYD